MEKADVSAIKPGMLRAEAAHALGLSEEELLVEASMDQELRSALEKSRTHAVAACMSVIRKAMAGKDVSQTEYNAAQRILEIAESEK